MRKGAVMSTGVLKWLVVAFAGCVVASCRWVTRPTCNTRAAVATLLVFSSGRRAPNVLAATAAFALVAWIALPERVELIVDATGL
jgi:hypothetical protein